MLLAEGWDVVIVESFIDDIQLEQLRALNLPVPEVGLDIQIEDETVGTPELSWPAIKVAVFDVAPDGLPAMPGWLCISCQSPEWLAAVEACFNEE